MNERNNVLNRIAEIRRKWDGAKSPQEKNLMVAQAVVEDCQGFSVVTPCPNFVGSGDASFSLLKHLVSQGADFTVASGAVAEPEGVDEDGQLNIHPSLRFSCKISHPLFQSDLIFAMSHEISEAVALACVIALKEIRARRAEL